MPRIVFGKKVSTELKPRPIVRWMSNDLECIVTEITIFPYNIFARGLMNVTVFGGVHDWIVTTCLCADDVTLSFRVYGIFRHIGRSTQPSIHPLINKNLVDDNDMIVGW